jgi:hypothetical protein
VLPPGSIHTADISSCQTIAAGINDTRNQALGYTTTAPLSIGSGTDFTVTVRPDPSSIPLSQQGFTVAGLRDHIYRVGLPTGVTYVTGSGVQGNDDTGYTLTDGHTPTHPTSTFAAAADGAGAFLQIDVNGTIPGGGTGQAPTETFTLHAGATAVSPIQLKGHGFSYGTLGDKIITSVLNVGQVSTSCYDTLNINSKPPVFGATPMTNITIN